MGAIRRSITSGVKTEREEHLSSKQRASREDAGKFAARPDECPKAVRLLSGSLDHRGV